MEYTKISKDSVLIFECETVNGTGALQAILEVRNFLVREGLSECDLNIDGFLVDVNVNGNIINQAEEYKSWRANKGYLLQKIKDERIIK